MRRQLHFEPEGRAPIRPPISRCAGRRGTRWWSASIYSGSACRSSWHWWIGCWAEAGGSG